MIEEGVDLADGFLPDLVLNGGPIRDLATIDDDDFRFSPGLIAFSPELQFLQVLPDRWCSGWFSGRAGAFVSIAA